MQRINENAYIDDTLVTCAEYQLFIDEVREQGEYYQPDHWVSYQFSAGQAREPILGVRYSDAVAFCEWLTGRTTGEWKHRLPTPDEASDFPMKYQKLASLGYWIGENNQFAWIERTSYDAGGIDRAFDLAVALPFSKDLAINRIRDRVLDRVRASDRAVNLAIALDFALDHTRSRALERARDHAYEPSRDHAISLARDPALSLARNLASARNCARDLALIRDRASDLGNPSDLDRALDLAHELDLALSHARGHASVLALGRHIDICIGIFTLQERIAGCSPAIEGIRLVKERDQ